MRLFPLIAACGLLTACNVNMNTADYKYSVLKDQALNCKVISEMHARNEEVVDKAKPVAESEGKGLKAAQIIGALVFTPIALAAQAKAEEVYAYRHNLRENEALRKLAAEKNCPIPKSKYPDGEQ